jgi:hypothetical protein
MKMIKTPASSSIKEHGYEEHTETLSVRYVNDRLYHYHGVPKRVYDFLKAADSAGQYINKHVKNQYKYTPQNEEGAKR